METENPTSQISRALALRLVFPCAILALGWLGFSFLSVEIEEESTPTPPKRTLRTKVVELKEVDYPVTINTNGVVQAHNRVTLAAEINGVITKVNPSFEVGSYFSKDDVLVEIDDRNYKTAVSIAESQLLAAKSALKLASLNEERKLRLIKANAVSQAEVESASAVREQSEADLELAATRLEQAKLDLKRTVVKAPFDGRVQTKNIGLGQMANANSPLGDIFAIDFAEVRLPISGLNRQFLKLPEFSSDSSVDVALTDALNDASEITWQAQIVRTEGVLDENSRDLFAIARINDPFGRKTGYPPLRIGQPVIASIGGITLKNVIALPRNAVRQLDKIVLVDRKELTLLPMTIESLWSDAENVIVDSSTIPQGMLLATTPMVYTPKGAKVEIIPDAVSPDSIAENASKEATDSTTN